MCIRDRVSHGFGLLLPHQTFKPKADGTPSQQPVTIRTTDELLNNVTPSNPILAPTQWPTTTILPNGLDGNHFIYAQFTQPLNVDSVLDRSPAGQVNSGLTGTITVVGIDSLTGSITPIKGRAFVGGMTYAGQAIGSPALLPLQSWICLLYTSPSPRDQRGSRMPSSA